MNKLIIFTALILLTTASWGEYIPNKQGNLLYEEQLFSIYKKQSSDKASKSEWCNGYSFEVSVVFNVEPDFVLTYDLIFEKLYKDLLPELKDLHCPNAEGSISSEHYLKNFYFKADGTLTSESEAKESLINNFSLSSAIYNADFYTSPKTPKPSKENVRIVYRESAPTLNQNEKDNEFGSLTALQDFYARGRVTEKRYAELMAEKAEIDKMHQFVENLYGAPIKDTNVARILADKWDEIPWGSTREWKYLRTYIWTTTKLCGSKTVGTPLHQDLYFSQDGKNIGNTGYGIWFSENLKRKVEGGGWGNVVTGLAPFEKYATEDFENIVNTNGCASKPLARIEEFFLRNS